jgi:NhaA family Na+:H+ antiporter
MSSKPTGLPRELADRFTRPLRRFLRIEAAAGILLLSATLAALAASNSRLEAPISDFWETAMGFRFGRHEFVRSARHWVNDALMTFFFFVVALELKRELVTGELRSFRKAAFPMAGAIGGIVFPPLIYLGILHGTPEAHGWGAATTTDTAFALGTLALLGRRIPVSLRLFLLSLAIFDDVGAILIVAAAYGGPLSWPALAASVGLVAAVFAVSRAGIRSSLVYLFAGTSLWLTLDASGVHPSIAGVLLGLMTPAREWVSGERLQGILERVTSQSTLVHRRDPAEQEDLRTAGVATREAVSPVERLELRVHPWSGFLVMPLFALANAGVPWSWHRLTQPLPLALGIALAVGKPVGVLVMLWFAVRTRIATRPPELSWPLVAAASILTGIGFTMSIFIANLAFAPATVEVAKMGILAASAISGVVGLLLLLGLTRARPVAPNREVTPGIEGARRYPQVG